jgi:hypothetical protein
MRREMELTEIIVHTDSISDTHLKHTLLYIIKKETQIMATLSQLQTAITEIQTDVATLTAALVGDVIIAPADSDALLGSLNALAASIKAIVPAPVVPPAA